MASTQEPEVSLNVQKECPRFYCSRHQQIQPLSSVGPVRRTRRRHRSQMENSARRLNRDTNSVNCAPMTDAIVEAIEVIDVNQADISCIDITEDDDVVCIGSERSDVLPLRTISRRDRGYAAQFSNTQFPTLIGSGVTVNSFGPPLNPVYEPAPVTVGKVIKCSVCLDDFTTIENSGKRLMSTNCGHVFCEPCIKEAIRATKSCPSCRKKLSAKGFHQIFL